MLPCYFCGENFGSHSDRKDDLITLVTIIRLLFQANGRDDMTVPSIEVNELTKYFGDFAAVDRLNLEVHPGEILALLGPNGAGKTTTIRLLSAILKPTSGYVRINGMDVSQFPEQARKTMGILTENHGLYSRMRPLEYLEFFGEAYGLSREAARQKAMSLLDEFGLLAVGVNRYIGDYSKGMRQKLALVRTLLHNPDIVLLDEPTSAMDPASARQVREIIQELRMESRTILLCTHNLSEAEFTADRIVIMAGGRIVTQGTIEELRRNLLGDPVLELRYDGEESTVLGILKERCTLLHVQPGTVRFTSVESDDTPAILYQLHKADIKVFSIGELSQSLEEIYLQVVEKESEEEAMIAR